MDPVTVNCTIIDWCEVTAILFDTFMAACFTVLLGGIVALGVNWYRRRQFRLQEEVLQELAELRTRGVAIRNQGIDEPFSESDLIDWIFELIGWEHKVLTTAKIFSPVEAERLKTLDRIPALGSEGFEAPTMLKLDRERPEQAAFLNYYSELLRRLDVMLELRFRPTQSP